MYVSKSCVVYCFIIVDVSAFHWNLIKSIFLRRKKNHNRNWIVFLYLKRYFFTLVSIQRHPSNSSETVASEYYEQKSPLVGVKNVRN